MASKRFEDSLIPYLRERFPNEVQSLPEPEIREMIKHAIKKARSYGITTRRGIAKYAEVMQYLGVNFDQDPKWPWARYLLTDKQKPNAIERISTLYIEVLKRMSPSEFPGIEKA